MLELTPQERVKLRYIQLFEEQMIWKSNQQEKSLFNKLLQWIKA